MQPAERLSATDTPSDDRHSRRLFALILAVYVAGMTAAALLGYRSALSKAIALPAILLFALATNRFRAFTRDWLVFLAVTVLFDNVRALIFSATATLEWPIYLNYAIEWERALLGGQTAPHLLQNWFAVSGEPSPFDQLMVIVHGSHFIYFLLFCLGIWCYAPADFARCRRAMMTLMVLGLVGYLVVPTVPPHIAAGSFGAIAPLHWLRGEIYAQAMPHVQPWFDTNPIAAMPSLHAAFPSLCALIAVHHLRWRAWPLVAYAGCVLFSIMYLGEHYAVDLLAGIGLALFCFALFYPLGTRLGRERIAALRRRWGGPPASTSILRPALLALLLFAFAETGEKLATEYRPIRWMHPRFVERELAHHPGARDLFLANDAFDHGNFSAAVHHYERALPKLDASHRIRVRQALARCTRALEFESQPPVAFRSNAARPAAVRTLGPTSASLRHQDRREVQHQRSE
jgi:hypothetical protein